MTRVAASILSADFWRLGEEVEAACAAGADGLHLDLMDGHFVPNLSFGVPVLKHLKGRAPKPMDVHAMVSDPTPLIEGVAAAGVTLMTVHVEACPHLQRVLAAIREAGMQAGVALNPGTSPDFLPWVAEVVDFVLVMSVNPGFSGQAFLPSAVEKVRAVRRILGEDVSIGVDGGVTPANSRALVEAGADVLIAATAIFGEKDYRAAIQALRDGR